MKNFLLLIIISALAVPAVIAQGSEIGPFAGVSYYMGDINPGRQFYNAKPAFGLVYRKLLNPRYAIKANFIYGQLEAFDSDSDNPAQVVRNLDFRTNIFDLSGQIEFNFLPYELGDPTKPFSPYIFAGLSIFRFNPQGTLNGEWVDLHPLRTEGQGTAANPGSSHYSRVQLAFPFGAGLKVALGARLGLSLEWSLRRTFFDYLDDVSGTYPDLNILAAERGADAAPMSDKSLSLGERSGLQRGNSKNNDWYSFAGIALTYKIGPKIQKCPAYKN
jgi:hypothetical protein